MDRRDQQVMKSLNVVIFGGNDNLIRIENEVLAGFHITNIRTRQTLDDLYGEFAVSQPDLVLMNDDARGLAQQACAHLRSESESPNPFVVIFMVTGDATPTRIRTAIRWGVDEIIGLPFRPIDFLSKLRATTKRRRKYVKVGDYFGPDRRRMVDEFAMPHERRADGKVESLEVAAKADAPPPNKKQRRA